MNRILAGVLSFFLLAGTVMAYETYTVNTDALNVRNQPVNGQVVGQLSQGYQVTVYGVRGEWALISPQGESERWVSLSYLTPQQAPRAPAAIHRQPVPAPQVQAPRPSSVGLAASADSRIAKGAFPVAGRDGFTQHDVDILMRGARQMLDQGRCDRVEFAYKSTLNPGQYYVYCGNRSVFFTEADLSP